METPFNHFFNDRIYPGTLDELTRGPLAAHLKTYAQQLRDEGYAIQTGQYQLRMLGHFNRWLQSEGFTADEIDSSTVKRFVRSREKTGKLRKGDTAALARMLRMLRAGQTEVPSSPPTACQTVVQQFQHYLRQERGLSEAKIMRQTPVVSALMAECFPTEIPDFHEISASDIAGFVQRQAERITTKSAPTVVRALRSFFRHLLHRGAIETDMAACVSTISTWSLSGVPKFLPAEQIQRVLDSALHLERLWDRNISITTRLVDTVSTPMLLNTLLSQKIDPKLLITHRFKLDRILDAYETFAHAANTRALKVIIEVERQSAETSGSSFKE